MAEEKIYFTPEDAAKALPLVKRIVEDILAEGRELKKLAAIIADNLNENDEVQRRVAIIQRYIDELHEIGCFYKDWNFNFGVVDFPSIIDGREVMLCWRSDEEKVLYYHDAEEGYGGRKLIPPEYLGVF